VYITCWTSGASNVSQKSSGEGYKNKEAGEEGQNLVDAYV